VTIVATARTATDIAVTGRWGITSSGSRRRPVQYRSGDRQEQERRVSPIDASVSSQGRRPRHHILLP
jgi:hypothetical protein